MEAAKSIAKATNELIKAAREAQRELISQGKVSFCLGNLIVSVTCLLYTSDAADE